MGIVSCHPPIVMSPLVILNLFQDLVVMEILSPRFAGLRMTTLGNRMTLQDDSPGLKVRDDNTLLQQLNRLGNAVASFQQHVRIRCIRNTEVRGETKSSSCHNSHPRRLEEVVC